MAESAIVDLSTRTGFGMFKVSRLTFAGACLWFGLFCFSQRSARIILCRDASSLVRALSCCACVRGPCLDNTILRAFTSFVSKAATATQS